ncbi:hypothetical protein NP493_1767g00004 [Ridgeia piscesae]|uniref:Uncharacterized protein n=1 Tax=Ridgeia piscesae TaxID=27915 RepID=A0AAD9JTA6_RIDPI|nr:hypothetical protein NP493_1767g00004 [Ridgeia piscesae]
MAKCVIALMVLVAVYAAEGFGRFDGCFNGYNYDCCRHRRPNFYYPSLSKPLPYYYRCAGRRVVYGRCPSHQCVTVSGSCGHCNDHCSHSLRVSVRISVSFYGRYYYNCNHGALRYHSCGLNQSFYPGRNHCGCRESYCERYSGWQSTVCNGCHRYVYCKWGRPLRYRRCHGYRHFFDHRYRRCVHSCNNCCGHR